MPLYVVYIQCRAGHHHCIYGTHICPVSYLAPLCTVRCMVQRGTVHGRIYSDTALYLTALLSTTIVTTLLPVRVVVSEQSMSYFNTYFLLKSPQATIRIQDLCHS